MRRTKFSLRSLQFRMQEGGFWRCMRAPLNMYFLSYCLYRGDRNRMPDPTPQPVCVCVRELCACFCVRMYLFVYCNVVGLNENIDLSHCNAFSVRYYSFNDIALIHRPIVSTNANQTKSIFVTFHVMELVLTALICGSIRIDIERLLLWPGTWVSRCFFLEIMQPQTLALRI